MKQSHKYKKNQHFSKEKKDHVIDLLVQLEEATSEEHFNRVKKELEDIELASGLSQTQFITLILS